MAERKVTAKALMRERATRRARIARRTARKQRLLIGIVMLLLATVGAWVAVATTTLSVWVPIVLTAGAGAGSWFTFVVSSQIAEANEHDEARIAHIATMLTRKATPAQRDFEAMRAGSGDEVAGATGGAGSAGGVAVAVREVAGAEDMARELADARVGTEVDAGEAAREGDRTAAEHQAHRVHVRAEVPARAKVQEGAQVKARPPRIELDPDILRGRAALADPHRPSLEVREPAQMPSYTVKPEVRRVVARPAQALGAMELAGQDAEANVPYRPKRIGEQLPGVEQGAREVSGLAGGSVLDELLKRRRA